MLEDRGILFLGQGDGHGHQQHLGLDRFLVGDEPVVEDPLVGRVFVDHQHLAFELDEDVRFERFADDAEIRQFGLFGEGHDRQVFDHRKFLLRVDLFDGFRFRFLRRAVRLADVRHGAFCL